MQRDERERRLFNVFLDELDEHRGALSRDLLKLEQEQEQKQRVLLLAQLFRAAHSLKGAARSVRAAQIERVCHRLEHQLQLLQGSPELGEARIKQLFEELDALNAQAQAFLAQGATESAASAAAAPAESATRTKSVPPAPAGSKPPDAVERRALRVSAEKTDALLSRAADLLILSSGLNTQLAAFDELRALCAELNAELPERELKAARVVRKLTRAIEQQAEQLERSVQTVVRASERLDDDAQRLRLVSFDEACDGLERAARDLARDSGKPVELSIHSNGVEIDRAIAQRLRDPLLHLLRNAMSHGIESAAQRTASGKPAQAQLRISASLVGKSVEVTFQDDGRGFDGERIRARAAQLGLPLDVSERELLHYAFLPGFSTAEALTEIAGRGVGLDAVAGAVEALHGAVELASQPGRGATFVLRLPLTLSKLRCVFACAGGRWYALPASHVLAVVRFTDAQLATVEGKRLLKYKESLLPLASLSALLGHQEADTGRSMQSAIILSGDGRQLALLVDELGDEREITARALPGRVAGARQVSAATLLGMGKVALVLNPQDLSRRALLSPLAPASRGTSPRRARTRVLVADDSATTRAVLKSVLEEAAYEVTTAQDGEEAFTLLQAQPFDIVLSDVQMPHRDGFWLAATIRQHERLARLPVVLMTSLESESDRMRGLAAGASAYLTKSGFDHQTLLETLSALL